MSGRFFECPILNSPYDRPQRHWQLDERGQPTGRITAFRRKVDFVTPIPKPKKRKGGKGKQFGLALEAEEARRLASKGQQYALAQIINDIRGQVARWRELPEAEWRVTPETARLLRHWRQHRLTGLRPFFCQVEAVETVIWLTEVAPSLGNIEKAFLKHLEAANKEANPGLSRLALKLATGAGKTTVMAMLIAWQTINAQRHPGSRRFTRGFLVVTPGITIRDRLRVLKPNDLDSYYRKRELVPADMLADLKRARIVIVNFHTFKRRETMALSKGGRDLLRGRSKLNTQESEGQMLRRVMPELMGMKNVMALNDEAHHCYREKAGEGDEDDLTGDDRREAEENREAARLWISGLETVGHKLGLVRVVDLSATPFFLRGSGYAEGTLFPWTASDFSLMDAIECGIVKLPRVPVADNDPGAEIPKFRNLWDHIGKKMPKKAVTGLDPEQLPTPLLTALDALYGHYERVFEQWQQAGIDVPPCFIVVCNNTATSKLLFDYIAGFTRPGATTPVPGHLALFRNWDEAGNRLGRPRTVLIDSRQLESGEALDKNFRALAAGEIERFRREIVARTGDRHQAENLSDQDLLREVLNTVGKAGRLGGETRCVVSVSMLTEGWDANTVTHILGVRAFGTQLLCEQVVGRALRRHSYDLNPDGLFDAEYADVFGIPFDFTARPVAVAPKPPRKVVQVKAVPERSACEIRFPRIAGYRVELPEERLEADFGDDSTLELTPEMVGPAVTRNEPIVGEGVDLTVEHLDRMRRATLLFHLTKRLLETKWRDGDEAPKCHLFGQLKAIAGQWLDRYLACKGGTREAQVLYRTFADMACERIASAIVARHAGEHPVTAVLDPYNPEGSTAHVHFATSKTTWRTHPARCHIDHVVCDSGWEEEFCRVAEAHPAVLAYAKNEGLGLEIPYRHGSEPHIYLPDFILLLDDGAGAGDPLHLIVEIKGKRRESDKDKKMAVETYWLPGVNRLARFGRWDFAEFRDVHEIEADFAALVAGLRGGSAGNSV